MEESAALESYVQVLRTMQGTTSVRAFASEAGVNQSTAARLLRSGEALSAPSQATHRRFVNYAIEKGLTRDVTALERAWAALAPTPETDFQRVFGWEIAQGQAALILPAFHGESLVKARAPHPLAGIGPKAPLTDINDVRALIVLHEMIRANASAGSEGLGITPDHKGPTSLSELTHSAFAVGLYNNDLVSSYAKEEGALVGVTGSKPGYAGDLVVSGQRFQPGQQSYAFVIARLRPVPDENPDRVCILCAGTSGAATLHAAQHLRDEWQWFTRFASDVNFAAVFTVGREGDEPELEAVISSSSLTLPSASQPAT